MKLEIKYKFANGETACVEVSGEIAELHLEMEKERKSSDRRHFRRERYMSFDEYERYIFIDADGCGVRIDNAVDKPLFCFSTETAVERNAAVTDRVEQLMSCLNDRQRYLVCRCILNGDSYTQVAREEGKDESAIRKAVGRALKKVKKNLS